MYIVYILFSFRDYCLYIGLTQRLHKRLLQHSTGGVQSTKERRPIQLIYYEVYHERSDAIRRERYLKGGNGRANLKIQLQKHLRKLGYRHLY